ncbi:zinc-dependent peptidase, partial [Escherichia sp. HC-CC]
HEVAHKLDTRNGDRASGVPFIPLREVAGWEHDLHAAMNNIQEEIELVGENAASIDAYAASSDLTEQYVGYAPDRYRLPIHHRPQMAQDKLRLHENHPAIPVLTPERVGKIEVLSGSFLMNPVQSPVKEQAAFAVLSEYFFSAPELFAPRFPSLWQRFC